MARLRRRAYPRQTVSLNTTATTGSSCEGYLRADYRSRRVVVTLDGPVGLDVQVRRCHDDECSLHKVPVRAEAEGRLALPQQGFGLDVIALVGALRHQDHRSVPEIHAALRARHVSIAERTVTNLLDRYDDLVSLAVTDLARLRRIARKHGRVVLALDGLQSDVGHEVLWEVRDRLTGEILHARTMLSARQQDLAAMLREVREAARPVFEADRHAKKPLKKTVRGVRPIERAVEGKDDADALRTATQ